MAKSVPLVLFFLLVLALAALGWQFQRSSPRIAYVDSVKLLNGYRVMAGARKAYEAKARNWQTNIDTLSSETQQAIRDFEKAAGSMTVTERKLSTERIRTKQQELRRYQQAIQEAARQEEAKGTQEVISQVNGFLEEYGQTHGYDLILVATPAGSIAYAKPGLDLTDKIVLELNEKHGKYPK
jgi:outer membrane protein